MWKGQKSTFFPGIQSIKSEIINKKRIFKLLTWMKDKNLFFQNIFLREW